MKDETRSKTAWVPHGGISCGTMGPEGVRDVVAKARKEADVCGYRTYISAAGSRGLRGTCIHGLWSRLIETDWRFEESIAFRFVCD